MVRINLFPARLLSDQHLIAEYREIICLLGSIRTGRLSIERHNDDLTLGSGHINFFRDKLVYLFNRHQELVDEMVFRNFLPNYYIYYTKPSIKRYLFKITKSNSLAWSIEVEHSYLSDSWEPKLKDFELLLKRISIRLKQKPELYKYFGKVMEPEFFINLMQKWMTKSFIY